MKNFKSLREKMSKEAQDRAKDKADELVRDYEIGDERVGGFFDPDNPLEGLNDVNVKIVKLDNK